MSHAPERLYSVSIGQLSIARLYGRCKFNGALYWYVPESDTLVRDDVFRREQKVERAKNVATLKQLQATEGRLKARKAKQTSDLAKTREELAKVQAEIKAARAAPVNGKG